MHASNMTRVVTVTLCAARAPFNTIAVPISSVTKLERRNDKRIQGAWFGSFAGGLLGALLSSELAEEDDCDRIPFNPFSCADERTLTGIAVGGVIGGFIGFVAASDLWEEVPLDQVRPRVITKRDGFGLALTVRF